MSPQPTPTVRHDDEHRAFLMNLAGRECRLDYRLQGTTMVIVHTEVPPALEGRGLAARLMQAAVDHARLCGWRVRPVCSYARVWLRRHPGHADLIEQ